MILRLWKMLIPNQFQVGSPIKSLHDLIESSSITA